MITLRGTAIIRDTSLGRLPLTLDTENDVVVLELAEGTAMMPDVLRLMLSGNDVLLEDVVVETTVGQWSAASLGPFMADFSNADNRQPARADSTLGQAMFPPRPLATNRIRLTPYSSRLVFDAGQASQISEIWFWCPHKQALSLTLDAAAALKIKSVGGEDSLFRYITVTSDEMDVSKLLTPLTLTLSLLLRRRAFHLAVQHGTTLEINLASPSRTTSVGAIARRGFLDKVAQPLFDHLRSQTPVVSEGAAHFLIEGFSNPGTLEVRLLNAFVYLEVIDGTETLDKSHLARLLGISIENAEVIKHIRNAMSHKGVGIVEALHDCRSKMGPRAQSSILADLEILRSPHGEFYGALMDLLSQHLLNLVGAPEELVHRNGHASFGRNGATSVLPD